MDFNSIKLISSIQDYTNSELLPTHTYTKWFLSVKFFQIHSSYAGHATAIIRGMA